MGELLYWVGGHWMSRPNGRGGDLPREASDLILAELERDSAPRILGVPTGVLPLEPELSMVSGMLC